MKNTQYISYYNWSLAIPGFLLTIYPKLAPLGLFVVIIVLVFGAFGKHLERSKLSIPALIFILFYLFYFFGFFFSDNVYAATKYLEYKSAMIIIPLLFLFVPKERMSLRPAFISMLIGLVIMGGIGLTKGLQCYLSFPDFVFCFSSGKTSPDHPTYYTAILTLLLVILWSKEFRLIPRLGIRILLTIFFGLLILINFSIAGILFGLLLISFVILSWIYNKYGIAKSVIACCLIPIGTYFMFYMIPSFRLEVSNTVESAVNYANDPEEFVRYKEGFQSGDDVRLIMWTTSFMALKDNPFGVGTGDVDLALSEQLKKYGQLELAKLDINNQIQYNPHNQYLQTGLELGLIGLIAFVALIFFTIKIGWKYKSWILIILGANLAFNSLFESMLQRQTGLIFYTFFICLLLTYILNNKASSR